MKALVTPLACWVTMIRTFPFIVKSTVALFYREILCLGCNNFMIRVPAKKNQSRKNLAEFQAYNPIQDSSAQRVSPRVSFFLTRGRSAE